MNNKLLQDIFNSTCAFKSIDEFELSHEKFGKNIASYCLNLCQKEEMSRYIKSIGGSDGARACSDLIRNAFDLDNINSIDPLSVARNDIRDAKRYRWLIQNSSYSIRCDIFGDVGMNSHKDSDLDSLIDAAMTNGNTAT